MKRLINAALICMTITSCGHQMSSPSLIAKDDCVATVNLTVSEGKRLIAKGILADPRIRAKLKSGMIIITRGSTDTYIAEEIAGYAGKHGSFLTGHIVPEDAEPVGKGLERDAEIILKDGKRVDMKYDDALRALKPGDIVLKGGNMLNYSEKKAAVCIMALDGGTTYHLLPYIGKGKAELIIPIGLEKDTSADLESITSAIDAWVPEKDLNNVPGLYLFKDGSVFTEIEALRNYADVKVFPCAIGGLSGREGGVTLTLAGSKEEIDKALAVVYYVRGEKPF